MNISNVKVNLDNGLPIRPLFVYVNYKAELNKQSKPLFLIKQYKINKFMVKIKFCLEKCKISIKNMESLAPNN